MRTLLHKHIEGMTTDELVAAIYRDHLTGLYNRRAFDMDAHNYKLVALIDLDSLKWINDHLGHRTGDAVLITLAQHLNVAFHGRAFRFSGDEYAVVSDSFGELSDNLLHNDRVYSFGIGLDIADADARLKSDKHERLRKGERAPRGVQPTFYSTMFDEDGRLKI